MNLRNVFIISVATGAVGIAGLGLAGPAAAVTVVPVVPVAPVAPVIPGTQVTFNVVAGSLQISMPSTSVNFGTATDSVNGANLSASLGEVKVTDARGSIGAGVWNTMVAATNLDSTAPVISPSTVGPSIAATNIGYTAGTITPGGPAANTLAFAGYTYDTSTGTPNLAIVAGELAVSSANATKGNHTAAWSPTVQIHIPANSVAGNYAGIITHSVA